MKALSCFSTRMLLPAFLLSLTVSTGISYAQRPDISPFIGQWTIDIQGGSVGWIEVRQEENYINGDILWGGGSVLPVSNIFSAGNNLLIIQRSSNVVRKRAENNNPALTMIVTD